MTEPLRLLPTLTLGLALALSLCLFPTNSSATKPLPPPPQNISARPEVKFVTPIAGTTLTGLVPFTIAAGAVDQIKSWQFGPTTDIYTTSYPVGNLHYDTVQLQNGPHTFVARATYESGAVAEAKLDVKVYNPSHQLTGINAVTYEPLDGKDAVVELSYSKPGLTLEVDLSELDSNFAAKRLRVNEVTPGVYRVVYRLSTTNTVPPGRHQAHVRAKNPQGEVVANSFEWQLRKHPVLPISVRGCQFSGSQERVIFSYETYHSVPQVKIDPKLVGIAPQHVRVSGPASLEVASPPIALRVTWQAPKAGTKSLATMQSRIFVTAAGYTGYYLCWVPLGETSATVTFDMKRPGYDSNLVAGEPVPSEVRVKVAVERADYAEGWREHALKILLPGASARAGTPGANTSGKHKKKRKVR